MIELQALKPPEPLTILKSASIINNIIKSDRSTVLNDECIHLWTNRHRLWILKVNRDLIRILWLFAVIEY